MATQHSHRDRRRSRRSRTCTLCGRTITSSEIYLPKYDAVDDAWTWHECSHCEILADWVIADAQLPTYSSKSLHDWNPASFEQLRIKVQFLKKWTREDGELYPVPELITEETATSSGRAVHKLISIAAGAAEPEPQPYTTGCPSCGNDRGPFHRGYCYDCTDPGEIFD